MSKEHPILFAGDMVRAILDGRKTQTRRPVKPQPLHKSPVRPYLRPREAWTWVLAVTGMGNGGLPGFRCPYGVPGDTLWVRETWLHEDNCCDDHRCGNPDHIWYRASEKNPEMFPKWRPSIHMPRWASRTELLVKAVRVERVQDITGNDILADGVGHPVGTPLRYGSVTERWNRNREFAPLWNSIYAKKGLGWEANPWVWVVEFVRTK